MGGLDCDLRNMEEFLSHQNHYQRMRRLSGSEEPWMVGNVEESWIYWSTMLRSLVEFVDYGTGATTNIDLEMVPNQVFYC